MPTAALAFDFDPLLHLGDGAVRWETVAIAASIFGAIVLAGVAARASGLRVDDLLFVVLGIVPGAVIGGRLGYVLLHPAFFTAVPGRILDPGVGSLELTVGVVGGALTGSLVALLLDGRPGPWLRACTFPTLFLLVAGKLAMVLGGTGQGLPTSGEPATAYLGSGPWGSLGPAVASIPSQALEAIATAIVVVVIVLASLLPQLRRSDGRLFLFALAGWAVGRAVVASTWRDPVVAGQLRAEQVIAAVVAIGSLALAIVFMAIHRGQPEEEPAPVGTPDGAPVGPVGPVG
ncbi:MAG TPA: prolipoprotein diacylglyceryl transferase family protein [Candidatus Limnocylindrales bacterium]|nr:prolipoprotein diacylglyceryl transferase family protein [Candidatus Limnocylindrales bacterium]